MSLPELDSRAHTPLLSGYSGMHRLHDYRICSLTYVSFLWCCSNPNSHRCAFENLSEISVGSEGRTVVDVEEVLERYSERLLQMVSTKLKNSMST